MDYIMKSELRYGTRNKRNVRFWNVVEVIVGVALKQEITFAA